MRAGRCIHGGQLRDQRDSRLKCRATTDGSVEPVESFDPNDLFAQGCLQVHQISDRVWVYHDMVTPRQTSSASQHTTHGPELTA
jgi:hypothetical protein